MICQVRVTILKRLVLLAAKLYGGIPATASLLFLNSHEIIVMAFFSLHQNFSSSFAWANQEPYHPTLRLCNHPIPEEVYNSSRFSRSWPRGSTCLRCGAWRSNSWSGWCGAPSRSWCWPRSCTKGWRGHCRLCPMGPWETLFSWAEHQTRIPNSALAGVPFFTTGRICWKSPMRGHGHLVPDN